MKTDSSSEVGLSAVFRDLWALVRLLSIGATAAYIGNQAEHHRGVLKRSFWLCWRSRAFDTTCGLCGDRIPRVLPWDVSVAPTGL